MCKMSRGAKDSRGLRRERRVYGRKTHGEGTTAMYLSEKHDGSAPARTRQAPSRPPQQNLPRWRNGTDFYALTVVPIPYRSAYGLYVSMSSLTVKTSKTRNVETKICHLRSPRITIDYQNGENDVHDHSKSSTPTSPHTVWHCLVTISRLCPASLCTHHR